MTLNSRLAAYFAERPYIWLDGMELARIAGSYAWRSRCSDLRRLHGMTIENRQRRQKDHQGRMWTTSFYCYVPDGTAVPDFPAAERKPGLASPERFWQKVEKTATGCWEWQGVVTSWGYGHVYVKGKLVRVHRHAWTLTHGPIPDGMVMFSTGKDDWETPSDLFARLDAEFRFWIDGAANEHNHKCQFWWGPGGLYDDALAVKTWRLVGGPIWINPPYSRGLQGKFIAKAATEARDGATVVMLLPARTDTKVFHAHIWNREMHAPRKGVEVRFLKGRLKFVGAPASAPFPSMVVVFGEQSA